MKEHVLKCWPEPFMGIVSGDKVHEFRVDDRGFEVGDVLVLREWTPAWLKDEPDHFYGGTFTGHQVRRRVTYLSRGPDFGIPKGYVVMSLAAAVPAVRELPPVDRDHSAGVSEGLL